MVIERDIDVVYPRNFLTSVACELRFSPLLIIKDIIPQFQKEISEELPDFSFPFLIGKPPMDIPLKFDQWTFSSKKIEWQLKVGLNKFTVITKKYTLFSDFLNKSMDYFHKFSKISEIDLFKRVGLRYVNKYTLKDQDSPIKEVFELFRPKIFLKTIQDKESPFFRTEIRYTIENCRVTCWNVFEIGKDGKISYMVDIDAYTEEDVNLTDLEATIKQLHDFELEEFHRNIKDKFEGILKEVI